MARKVLIATSYRWLSAARLAMEFVRAGCEVDAICPRNHPIFSMRSLQTGYRYRALTPLRCLRAAILSSRPDLVVPSDDLVMMQLHRLYHRCNSAAGDDARFVRETIGRSMGDPAGYSIAESQERLMALAREEKIRTPEVRRLTSLADLDSWFSEHEFPAVLKADGTSGGEGVRIVRTRREAVRAYRKLRAPLHTAIVAKRACLDDDWTPVLPWLRQRRREVGIQTFVHGPDANIAVSCWQGEVVASITVKVLQTWRPKGPATIIRAIENEPILEAARKIVRRLGFSGLCGFDFMMDQDSGEPFLIEMNARATQTCALPLGAERNLVAALCSKIPGSASEMAQHAYEPPMEVSGDTIALFPLAWHGDTSSALFQTAYHDIPWGEPELVRLGLKEAREPSPRERWMRRLSAMATRSNGT